MAGNCGTGAQAHNPQELAVKYFDQTDINEDGVVTKDEFTASPFSKILKTFDILQQTRRVWLRKRRLSKFSLKRILSRQQKPNPRKYGLLKNSLLNLQN